MIKKLIHDLLDITSEGSQGTYYARSMSSTHRDICLSNHFKIVQLLTEAVLSSCDFIMKESNNACF